MSNPFLNLDPTNLLSNDIITLIVFSRTENIAETARVLDIAKPTVLKRLVKLQKRLKFQLFQDHDPDAHGRNLTYNAKQLAKVAELSMSHIVNDVRQTTMFTEQTVKYDDLSNTAKHNALKAMREDVTRDEIESIAKARRCFYTHAGEFTKHNPEGDLRSDDSE